MKSYGHRNQKMILGPWGHTDTATRMIGERDFGNQAAIDLQREYIRWFDYWLKGRENRVMQEPLVRMFTMGSNKWHTGDSYPLEITQFKKLYFASAGSAATESENGTLEWDMKKTKADFDFYVYDPGNPTPDPAFYPTKSRQEREQNVFSRDQERNKRKAFYRQVANERSDILIYRTAPLEEPLTICGPISAVLYAASSARDTDWFVTLSEETEQGEIFSLVKGKIRARYRNSPFKQELLEAGEIYRYELDLWHTGITIPAGSRMRVEVASARFPTFSRNLNTGGHNEMETSYTKAEQRIYHSKKYATHILLPILP